MSSEVATDWLNPANYQRAAARHFAEFFQKQLAELQPEQQALSIEAAKRVLARLEPESKVAEGVSL